MASIQPRNVGGVTVGYYSVLGKDKITGKRPRKYHKNKADASAYIASLEAVNIGDDEIYRRKTEIQSCLQRLAEVNANLYDATEFYLKHGANKKPKPVGEAIDELIALKEQRGKSPNHINDLRIKLGTFRRHIKEATLIGDITKEQVEGYIYITQNGLSGVSKRNHIRILSLLFNFAVKRGYMSMNPTEDIDPPTVKFEEPKVMLPEDFAILLNHCYKNKWYSRVAVFALIGFCGIRKQEVSRLKWSRVHLNDRVVKIGADIAKGSYYRNNIIPENAAKWLDAVHDKRETGLIIGENWEALYRSAVHSAKVKHPKNCIRHSFASYAIGAKKWEDEEVSKYMGHGGDTKMIDTHYRNNVTQADALKWWNIVPESTE